MSAVEPAVLEIILGTGLAGVGLIAFWREWIVTGTAFSRERDKAAEWQKLYETETKAHAATREALVLSTRRADSADMMGEAAVRLLDGLSAEHRRRDVVAEEQKRIPGVPDGPGG